MRPRHRTNAPNSESEMVYSYISQRAVTPKSINRPQEADIPISTLRVAILLNELSYHTNRQFIYNEIISDNLPCLC